MKEFKRKEGKLRNLKEEEGSKNNKFLTKTLITSHLETKKMIPFFQTNAEEMNKPPSNWRSSRRRKVDKINYTKKNKKEDNKHKWKKKRRISKD